MVPDGDETRASVLDRHVGVDRDLAIPVKGNGGVHRAEVQVRSRGCAMLVVAR